MPDEEEEPSTQGGMGTHGLWWMYPHNEQDNFVTWVISCAWIWVAMSIFLVDWIDTAYYDGYGSVPLVMSLVLLSLLMVTCGRGPCYWIHRDIPWAVMIGSMILVMVILFKFRH
jgi:hypothetical protein